MQVSISFPVPHFLCSSILCDPSFSLVQHGAIRTTLSGPADYANDDASGFQRIEAREIDTIGASASFPATRHICISRSHSPLPAGTDGIIKKIRETVGDKPVYLSIDVRTPRDRPRTWTLTLIGHAQIDSIDPAFAPATGTPETGGWSTRELRTILRGLDGLHIVSADIVEVAPAYDTNAELTTMAAADVSEPIRSPLVFVSDMP